MHEIHVSLYCVDFKVLHCYIYSYSSHTTYSIQIMNVLDVQDRSRTPSPYIVEDEDVRIIRDSGIINEEITVIKDSPSPKPKHYGMNTYTCILTKLLHFTKKSD